MSQPPNYTRQFNFQNFTSSNPDDQQPGVSLDSEFNAIKTTADAVNVNLAKIQRDDGQLKNGIVNVDALDPALSASIGTSTVWATLTSYAVDDIVIKDNAVYKCLVAHLSGTFLTDLAAAKWVLIIDYSAAIFTATSVTSQTVSIASKTFTTQANKNFPIGSSVTIVSDANPTTQQMQGMVTAYSGTSLTVNVLNIIGSATRTDWTIFLSGGTGPVGQIGASGTLPIANAAGTVDAITANYTPDIVLSNFQMCVFVSAGKNTIANPTFAPDGLTAHTITKRGGSALIPGDIGPSLSVHMLEYNSANSRWELLNPAGNSTECFVLALSNETSNLTAGTSKVSFRMPYAFTVTEVRASLNVAATGTDLFTVDINEGGASILSTKLTFDASELTTTTAATPAVISDASLADDALITIDIDQIGSTLSGVGLKVIIIGYRT